MPSFSLPGRASYFTPSSDLGLRLNICIIDVTEHVRGEQQEMKAELLAPLRPKSGTRAQVFVCQLIPAPGTTASAQSPSPHSQGDYRVTSLISNGITFAPWPL